MDLSKLSDDQLAIADKVLSNAKRQGVTLGDDQLNIAFKVAKEAKRQGVNPDFVLPMVMIESGFNQDQVSKKGAIGVMQLMPDTAKGLKVDPSDIDQNIRGGVSLIKELMSNKKIGDDPYKVLVGYNASTETRNKFYQSGSLADLPDETLTHMEKVAKFYGGELPKVGVGQKDEEIKPEEPKQVEEGEQEVSSETPIASADNTEASDADRAMIGLVGGATGAKVAGGIETTKKVAPILPNIVNAMVPGRTVNPSLPQSRMSLQRYLNSQIAPNLRLPLTELEKVAGTGKIRTMSEVQTALDAIKAVEEQKVAKPVVKMVPGRPGQFETTNQVRTSTTPGRAGIDLTKYESNAGPARQAITRELQTAGEVGRTVLPSLGRVGLGALGGANAAMQAYDAYDLYQKEGLSPRVASKAAATVGGGLSMLPFGVTQVVGAGLQAPELLWEGYDYLNKPKEPQKPAKGGLSGG